ncbi:MAG: hypothetical protein HQM08_21360 [Candidatus Riflebacteria bacterium]|nr:hypothetical protein [Candidatus Riflebacteria bacterium]
MFSIKGKVQRGLGEAHKTLKEQMPYFEKVCPELAKCQLGTINIRLEKPVVVVKPDFQTEAVPWHPALKLIKKGEKFSFVKVKLKVEGREAVDAWIYKAQFSPYREDPFIIEVLAPRIDFSGTPDCSVEIISICHEGMIVISDFNHRKNGNI